MLNESKKTTIKFITYSLITRSRQNLSVVLQKCSNYDEHQHYDNKFINSILDS